MLKQWTMGRLNGGPMLGSLECALAYLSPDVIRENVGGRVVCLKGSRKPLRPSAHFREPRVDVWLPVPLFGPTRSTSPRRNPPRQSGNQRFSLGGLRLTPVCDESSATSLCYCFWSLRRSLTRGCVVPASNLHYPAVDLSAFPRLNRTAPRLSKTR